MKKRLEGRIVSLVARTVRALFAAALAGGGVGEGVAEQVVAGGGPAPALLVGSVRVGQAVVAGRAGGRQRRRRGGRSCQELEGAELLQLALEATVLLRQRLAAALQELAVHLCLLQLRPARAATTAAIRIFVSHSLLFARALLDARNQGKKSKPLYVLTLLVCFGTTPRPAVASGPAASPGRLSASAQVRWRPNYRNRDGHQQPGLIYTHFHCCAAASHTSTVQYST
jgi:hypothetical protein